MKLKFPKNCIDPATVTKKEIAYSDEYKKAIKEANKKIEENKKTQFIAAQQSQNYIHDYDSLPKAKQ